MAIALDALLVLSGAGCVLLPTVRGAPPELAPPAGPRPIEATRPASAAGSGRPRLDIRGVIHCHSELSHDSPGTLESIIEAAQATGVRFVFMTDHFTPRGVNEGARGLHGDVLFTAGSEMGRDKGSIMGVSIGEARTPVPGAFPVSPFNGTATAVARQIHEAGGLAFVGHCETFRGWETFTEWDGIEVVNLHAATVAKPWWFFPSALVLPPGAFFRRVVTPDPGVLERWDRLGVKRRVPGYGGCDAHASIRIFGPLGGVVGDYQECFRAVTTHLLASERTTSALMEALAEGRAYVAFEIDGDATGFSFDVTEGAVHEGSSLSVAAQGAEIRFRPGLRALVRCPGGDRVDARILRDGKVMVEGPGASLATPLEGPGVYRAEAMLDGRPFVLSNAIYVR